MAEVQQTPVHALLTDGTIVRIRPAGSADRGGVLRLCGQAPAGEPPWFPGRRTLVAEHAGRLLGVAACEEPREGSAAELFLAVADDWRHRGVGTLLVEHLADAARADGVTAFTADSLCDDHGPLALVRDLGLHVTRRADGPRVRCTIDLAETEDYLRAVDARGRLADTVSLRPLLRPRSVVVIGAGGGPGSVGRAILRDIRTRSFAGHLYAVDPRATLLCGVPARPAVDRLPEVPDLAVVAVPAPDVPAVARECGEAGVRALLVVSSHLDAGQTGALLAACRRHGMRMAGPHALGLANTEDGVRLDATFATHAPGPGPAGVAVQSGGVGIALLDALTRLGIGVSTFVALGDKYDVSGNDMLQWWEDDGRTGLALLHLESFGNPRAFSRTARRVARRMPLLTVDAGRSEAGRRAAAAHTAAAAARTMTRQALFTQAGITAARSLGELLDAAALLHAQPLPRGPRVAIIGNARGAGVLAADACADAGLTVPELPAALAGELLRLLPEGADAPNPVDATASVGEKQLRACVDLLAGHAAVDAVLVCLVPTAVAAATGDDLVRAVTVPGARPRPVVAVLPAQAARVDLLPARGGGGVPAYSDAQDAARALAHAARRAAWLAQPASPVPALPDVETRRARTIVGSFLERNPEGGLLDPRTTAALLGCYVVPQIPWAWARDEDEAIAAAERLAGADGRFVMTAYGPRPAHLGAERAVRLDLRSTSRLRAAHRELVARYGDRLAGVVVRPVAGRGAELAARVVQDDVFGPLVLLGPGGTPAGLPGDQEGQLAPLTERDARELITSARCAPALFGRGDGPAPDVEALGQLLHRLSRMACDLPQLAEADLDPLLAGADGVLAVEARVRLVPRRGNDPHLRRL
ncbi:GNAT family N-acetyltransferase [Streptomyces sp. NPDC020996]|uniref:bifunctional acetate--CoA ligase family protein/GNAT family N-acetyltransferase n=1 Tax=Streptomyces sp. NPDC020996 TaxID=3154791 RepID=UPI00340F5DCC